MERVNKGRREQYAVGLQHNASDMDAGPPKAFRTCKVRPTVLQRPEGMLRDTGVLLPGIPA